MLWSDGMVIDPDVKIAIEPVTNGLTELLIALGDDT
jgi:hypothetical protein